MGKNKLSLITIGFAFCLGLFSPGLRAAEVNLSFDHFYDHAELTRALQALEKAYPELAKVESIGKSFQGRDLWAIIITNPKTGPADRKPGYYIDGNIHGNEIQGGEVALYAAWYLLKNYGKTRLATRLLDEHVFYIVPTMNPDSRDYYIHKPADPNSPRSGLVPYDNDRDGTADEDGPEDLDGDGSITQMRRKDPNGMFKVHPKDPRIMVRVSPGEKGEYTILGDEGIDNDGDGMINEDSPGGYDMNRNFGYNWQPNYVQAGAGDYPFCWPETKAVRDFFVAHPNIAGAQTFHNYGGMILSGPGAVNLGQFPAGDKQVYEYVAKRGEKILPGYKYTIIYKDMYTVYGGSLDFFYAALGAFTFSNELDIDPSGPPLASVEERPSGREAQDETYRELAAEARMLNEMFYHDNVLMGEQYSDWKPYKHPLYGDVEIGGAKKFSRRVPPSFRLAETCHRNAAFVLYHADQLSRVEFDQIKVTKLKGGLYQVDVTLANNRVSPTITSMALQKQLHRVDRIQVEGPGAKILAAGYLMDRFRSLTRKIKTQDNFIWLDNGVPGFGKIELRLIVKGEGKINLVFDSLKGGYKVKPVSLE